MTESEAVEGHAFRAERTHDEVVLRFPSLNRLVRAFLPAEAVKHLYATQRSSRTTFGQDYDQDNVISLQGGTIGQSRTLRGHALNVRLNEIRSRGVRPGQ